MKRLGWVGLCLFVLATYQPACADDPDNQRVLAKILADWKKRQAAIHSIACKLSGTQFHPKGCLNRSGSNPEEKRILAEKGGIIPPQDTTHPLQVSFMLDLDRNWARKEIRSMVMFWNIVEFAPEHKTHLYCGGRVKSYQPREKNTSDVYKPSKVQPDLWLLTESVSDTFFASEDLPVFWGCGIVPSQGLLPQQMRKASDPAVFSVHGKAEIQGRKCIVVRATPKAPISLYYEYCVDAARDSAVLRCSLYVDNVLYQRTDVQNERHGDFWFPKQWTWSLFWPKDDGLLLGTTIRMQMDELVINPTVDASDFDVQLKPGMVVYDGKENTHGVIGDDGKTLLPLSEIDNVGKRPKRWLYVLAVACGLLVLLTAWIVWRKRYRRTIPA